MTAYQLHTEGERTCESACVPNAEFWKTAQTVYCDQESCITLCYSVVNCKTYSSTTHAGFCAQNFLQCVLNFTEQEPKPQKPGSLNPFALW